MDNSKVRNIIASVAEKHRYVLTESGANEASIESKGYAVDLEGDELLGCVCFWKPNLFEFHFVSIERKEDVLLETVKLEDEDALASYLNAFLSLS